MKEKYEIDTEIINDIIEEPDIVLGDDGPPKESESIINWSNIIFKGFLHVIGILFILLAIIGFCIGILM